MKNYFFYICCVNCILNYIKDINMYHLYMFYIYSSECFVSKTQLSHHIILDKRGKFTPIKVYILINRMIV